MKILDIDLRAYGPFTARTLDLTRGDPGLHLVYGDNEAGKSSALRALIAWLFGIETRTTDNFLHGHKELRVGGRLRLENGEEIAFLRRKGNKGTILDITGAKPLDDAILRPLLGTLSSADFRRIYGIDHQGLVEGGKAILEQGGDVGQALFGAALGVGGLRDLSKSLDDEASALFAPRGSKRKVNASVASYRATQKAITEKRLLAPHWKALWEGHDEAQEAVERLEREIEALEHERSWVQRAKRIMPPLAQYKEAQRERDALGDVRMLSEDAASQRQDALGRRRDASSRHQRAMEKRRHLEEKMALADSQINDKLLAMEGSINTIYREFGAVEKTLADLPRRQGELAEKRAAAEKTLHALGLDIALESAESLRPFLTRQRLIDELAKGRALLDQDQARIEKGLRQLRREGEAIAAELADMASPAEASAELGAVVDAARRAGDLPTRWIQSHRRLQDERDQLRQDLSRLGRFGGDIEALAQTALPHEETLSSFEARFDEAAAQAREHRSTERRLRRERAQAQERLQALRAISDIPSPSDLKDARGHRDKLWREIRQHFIEDAAPSSERPPSADSYEARVESADGLADRLHQHADAAAQEATLNAQVARLDEERVLLDTERQEAERKEAERQALWDAVWTPLGVDAASPKEMKAWTQRAEQLITRYRALMTTDEETRVLERETQRHVKALAAQVGDAAPIADGDPEDLAASFEALLEGATSILQIQTQAAEKRRALQRRASDNSLRQDESERDLADLQGQRERWKERWRGARANLPLGDRPDPTHALEVLRQLVVFFESFDDAVKLERRIETMEAESRHFAEGVSRLANEVGHERGGQDETAIVTTLHQRLEESRGARRLRDDLQEQVESVGEELQGANEDLKQAEDDLITLRKIAGVETDEELVSAETQAARARTLDTRLGDLTQQLLTSGDGLGVEELEAETTNVDIDHLGARLATLTTKLQALRKDRDAQRDEVKRLEMEAAAFDGSSKAAEAAEEAAATLARITVDAERYLELRLASLILTQQVERYRKAHQAPVLARATEHFVRLTLGSFSGLRDDLDDRGKPILLGIRPGGQEVGVAGLSEGSRDQLYLALRLATLEERWQDSEALPLIVDDILVGFDDARSRAALEVLAEIATKAQVILFTHHERLVDLAKELPKERGVFVHRLASDAK